MMRRIDIHSHFFPPLSRSKSRALGMDAADAHWLRDDGDGTGFIMTGEREYRPVQAPLWDPEARLAEMNRSGTTVQVISAAPVLFAYGGNARTTARWAAMINDQALEMSAADPVRLRALCQVPLQDIDLACAEVSRSCEAGHIGVHIGNQVQGRNLDDPELLRFLTHCAEENIAVLVHPSPMPAAERTSHDLLKSLDGMPAGTHLAVLSLILSGGFDRLPRELRICFTHSGGNFASQLGQVDNAWRRRDLVTANCPRPPSSYTDRFSVDSAVFSDDALALLLSAMGSERILTGSDYPFALDEIDPGSLIDNTRLVETEAKKDMLYRNAARFFAIDADDLDLEPPDDDANNPSSADGTGRETEGAV